MVLIAPEIFPPVAKILDFNKFLYDERKKKSAAKTKSKKTELKEVKFGPSIGVGDFNHFLERTKEWIEEQNRVKVSVVMKGREGMFPDVAMSKLNKFIDEMNAVAKPEAEPKRIGNMITIVLLPK